ncbi:hypothetical protein [Azospirillum sp. TSO22-1]|uniref:hypothetical protein n=1 Tax=Azospirillum sp. TSO22-1 TaxID=716789 RepID=UPI000D61171F|nr:hypothetical protein [Azospirillum sp. TSO22-1]PWC45761.1 hypothetical protein TSO221_15840 [Azospirillum sp. TSO22-1]
MTTTRTTIKTVTFTHPFALRGMDAERPAGTYVVETDEELIEPLSFAAYRRIATWIRLPQQAGPDGGAQTALIDPDELNEALGPVERADPAAPASPSST